MGNQSSMGLGPEDLSIRLLYARHAEDVNNVLRRLPNRAIDTPLTEQGLSMAKRLGERMKVYMLRPVIYSSPSFRAVRTAEIIAKSVNLDLGSIRILQELAEVNVGDLSGCSDSGAWELHNCIFQAWQKGDLARSFPGGEDGLTVVDRFYETLRIIGNETVDDGDTDRMSIAVGHFGVFWAASSRLIPASGCDVSRLPNCGAAELRVSIARPRDSRVTAILDA